MSRPKHYWHGIVRTMIIEYPKYRNSPNTQQEIVFCEAIQKAAAETESLPDGAKRMKAVKEVLYDRSKTYDGVALEMFYERHTVQNWINKFIQLVGKNAGY